MYFPATYSTLSPAALADFITKEYQFKQVTCKLLVRGVHDTYLVETNKEKYILRVYRNSHRSLEQISEEVFFLEQLHAKGVSVSHLVAGPGTRRSIHAEMAIEGIRHMALFTYAPGKVVKLLSPAQLRSLGREMARVHEVAAAYKPNGARWKYDLETTLFEPLKRLEAPFADDTESYAWLQQAAVTAAGYLSQVSIHEVSTGYCHFDFLPKNFHFEGDKVTFFDFDFLGEGWLVNDVMTFWMHLQLDVLNRRQTQAAADEAYQLFLDAYREIRPLTDTELIAVPYLGLGFWLFYMGFHTTHDQFTSYTQLPFLQSYTGVMKHLVNTFWQQ
ncbi:Ser/Thr protein kinase RdoA involved in Cpx stress response, MazF antagonist [Chitinophaga jiangningensis]|uniref:Ser/Thr protein kinase RdoA involved in Cpx stress response, MazF antagonist n=1 Tax=Chitinophaga jiangningensis TaxID=1419482 RepID=A0A1M6ZZ24_9BACT|nr:phosphotransferase [Chitinophaga jiangningensis]SHL35747.1 Ser/Thr protein kinase RdoA involved in Cpx stress response, MazF antagonist [Chitinophaga jiangningensis]